MSSTNPVGKAVVCEDTAYFTIPVGGGTQGLPTKQSALLGVDLVSGDLTAHASIKNAEAELGVTHNTDVVGCVG